jgi:hypothetical protein
MGIKGWIAKRVAKREIEKRGIGEKWSKVVGWLNAQPGRKRTIGAAFLAGATFARAMGWGDYDHAAAAGIEILDLIVPGCEILGVVFAGVGVVHAKREKRV